MSQEISQESFSELHTSLKNIHESLVQLSKNDFSKIHVDMNWSLIPYVKDHLDFLAEQTGELLTNLRDSPPPSIEKIFQEA
jgi:hypothetical protein